MRDFNLGDKNFRIGKIPAMRQFHILRRMSPLLSVIDPKADKGQVELLTEALSSISDADADYIIYGLLAGVYVDNGQGLGFACVAPNGLLAYQNLNLVEIMTLAFEAIRENFLEFLGALPQNLRDKVQQLSAQ